LPGGPDIGDCACLRRHNRKTDGPPVQGTLASKVIIKIFIFSPMTKTFTNDIGKIEGDNNPVGNMHESLSIENKGHEI
jgi:hypothetical protein